MLSRGTATFLDDVTAILRQSTGPDDRILAFPAFQIFYGLADRMPATFAFMHWLDVCPDHLAAADAARILADPPAAIVYMQLPPPAQGALEAQFRQGRPGGQRLLAETIEQLLPRYKVARVYRAPGSGFPVGVFVRNDAVVPAAPAGGPPPAAATP